MATAQEGTPPYRLVSWHLSAILGIAEAGAVVFCLPSLFKADSGEAAIGAMILLGVVDMVYVFHLVVITPFVAWHSDRRGTRLASRRSLWILAPLVPAPALMGLLLMADPQHAEHPEFHCDGQVVTRTPDSPPQPAPITACEPVQP